MNISEFYHNFGDAEALVVQSATSYIGWGKLEQGCSVGGDTLSIGNQVYQYGLGDHVQSLHTLAFPEAVSRFSVTVGVQYGCPFASSMCFVVEDGDGVELGRSPLLTTHSEPYRLEVAVPGCRMLRLRALDAALPPDEPGASPQGNANWCDPEVTLADGRKFSGSLLCFNGCPPLISFDYDGEPVTFASRRSRILEDTEELQRWQVDESVADGTLTLRVIYTRYRDCPVAEWHPFLLNNSDSPSGIVSNFKSLNLALTVPDISTGYLENSHGFCRRYPMNGVKLRRMLGTKNMQSDFRDEDVTINNRYPANHVRMDTDEGRSSAAWMPFFGVDISESEGVNFGIGWSGAWCADFYHLAFTLKIEAGMPQTHFRVLPGEELRQVSIFAHCRMGMSVEEGQNVLRRFLLKHHSPHCQDGALMRVPHSVAVWGGMSTDGVMKVLDTVTRHGICCDTFWMDAGWFGEDRPVLDTEYGDSDWSSHVGNWRVNRGAHPRGLKPIAEAAHRADMKFLLWVEIERVRPESPVAVEHPEWLLHQGDDRENLLLNLGNPDARQWALDTVERLVKEEHIDHYRQDFNFNTIAFWADADAPDRIGVTEMKYIDGLYRFWDALRQQHPDMLIDNCASGGRRIDFETMSRSICLFRSDMLGRPWFDCSEASQMQEYNLNRWVPLQAGAIKLRLNDDYGFMSGVGVGIIAGIFNLETPEELKWYREIQEFAIRMNEYFYHDVYLLAGTPENRRCIYACQYDAPESGSGLFTVFRRAASEETTAVLKLKRLDVNAKYELEWFRGAKEVVSGAELAAMTVDMPEPRSVKVCIYKRI